MKRKRYTEPQIVFALQQAEAGTVVVEICRKWAWSLSWTEAGGLQRQT